MYALHESVRLDIPYVFMYMQYAFYVLMYHSTILIQVLSPIRIEIFFIMQRKFYILQPSSRTLSYNTW